MQEREDIQEREEQRVTDTEHYLDGLQILGENKLHLEIAYSRTIPTEERVLLSTNPKHKKGATTQTVQIQEEPEQTLCQQYDKLFKY